MLHANFETLEVAFEINLTSCPGRERMYVTFSILEWYS